MSFIERLGMAGVKTVKFDTGRGGLTELTGLDVVAALSGLDDVCCHYAHAFLTNGTSRKSVDRVVEHLANLVSSVKTNQAKGLVVVALHENSMPQCLACSGSGIQQMYSDSLSASLDALPCPHCQGLGRKPLKIKERAKLIGIHVNTYTHNKDIYESELISIKTEIANIEQRINSHGKEKLG